MGDALGLESVRGGLMRRSRCGACDGDDSAVLLWVAVHRRDDGFVPFNLLD